MEDSKQDCTNGGFWARIIKILNFSDSKRHFQNFPFVGPDLLRPGVCENMAAPSSPPTREVIFGPDSEPEPDSSSESSQHEEDSTQAAATSAGKKRAAPQSRARLTVSEKNQAMQHFQGNQPEMTYAKLIDWFYKKFAMKKKLSRSTVSLWFSDKGGKRQQKEN
jgi:hypothetical protein